MLRLYLGITNLKTMASKYKNTKTGQVISSNSYSYLTYTERANYKECDSSGNFINSAIIGAVTDSALLGGLLGGSLLGGIAGDLLDGDLFD